MLKAEFTHFRSKPSPSPGLTSWLASLSVQLHGRTPRRYRCQALPALPLTSASQSCCCTFIFLRCMLFSSTLPTSPRSNHHQHSLYHSPSPFSTVCRDIFQRWKLEHILEVELKICSIINNKDLGNSLVVCTCTVGNMIPGQGIKIPEAACVLVTQLCLTIYNPMDCSPLGFSVHGIL